MRPPRLSPRYRAPSDPGSSFGARLADFFRRVAPVRAAIAFATVLALVLLAGVLTPAAGAAVAPPEKGWQQAIQELAAPGPGCFTAAYPAVKWVPTACKAAPKGTEAPRSQPSVAGPTETVGNGVGFFAHVTGQLTSVTGSFSVTPTTPGGTVTESGKVGGGTTVAANSYSVQLNVPAFTATQCASAMVPANCYGWEQFFYSTAFGGVEIEYWLINYDQPTCPSALPSTTSLAPGDCYLNPTVTPVSTRPISDLSAMTLTGSAAAGSDQATLTDGGQAWTKNGGDPLGLATAGNWNGTEFNVFGDDNKDEANFSGVQSIQVTTTLHNGTRTAPSCSTSFTQTTAETNNLNLAAPPTLTTQASPTMAFNETSAAPAGAPSCADAAGVGDTHLETFHNLFYDFQAQGDFELVGTGTPARSLGTVERPTVADPVKAAPSYFTVQERQVSGAPSWPNAAVNKAVAARVGTSDVAVCTAPTRLEVNGSVVNLANGTRRALPGGAAVSLSGNVYMIADRNGNSVQATVQAGSTPHIDVSVGLGQWPEAVRGLLANAGNTDNAIESSEGAVFTAPFAFSELYGAYGNSWRVSANQDLLSACNGKAGAVKGSNPTQTFYANDLPNKVASAARAACVAVGVYEAALLNACTVDVAVVGKQAAAVYRTIPAPARWGIILANCPSPAGPGGDSTRPCPSPAR